MYFKKNIANKYEYLNKSFQNFPNITLFLELTPNDMKHDIKLTTY